MATTKIEATIKDLVLPFTGAEYLSSLEDDREVWIYGERVKSVLTHPAFGNTARMIARLYDALHDPQKKGSNAKKWGDTFKNAIAPRI